MSRFPVACRDDLRCYRSDGHDGDHAYPSKIAFTFPDGTTGPGKWDPKTATVVPDVSSGEPTP